jgi:hypothetical protein
VKRLDYTDEQLDNLRVAFGDGLAKPIFTPWAYVSRNAKWTKKPEFPPGVTALPFERALRRYRVNHSVAGIGVHLGPILGSSWVLWGLDYDGAAKGPLPEPWPVSKTYTERSPSGGDKFHLVGCYQGEPLQAHKGLAVELYTTMRFLTLTGERIGDETRIAPADPRPFYAAVGISDPQPYQASSVATFVRAAPIQVWQLTERERRLLAVVRGITHMDDSTRDWLVLCELRNRGATDEEMARILCAGFPRPKLWHNKSYLAISIAEVRKDARLAAEAAERQAEAVNRLLKSRA